MPSNTNYTPFEPTKLNLKQDFPDVSEHLLFFSYVFLLKRTIPKLSAMTYVYLIRDFFNYPYFNPELAYKVIDSPHYLPSRSSMIKGLHALGLTQVTIAEIFRTTPANIYYHMSKKTEPYVNPYLKAIQDSCMRNPTDTI